MHPMLNIAIRAIRRGGNIIVQNYDTQKFIKEDIDKKKIFIKNIMYKTYRIINEVIYKSYPNHVVLDKNTNFIKNDNNTLWVINELDGKNNFIKNFPHFCISIAVVIKNNTEISVIYDPIRNDLFTAVKGQGSQLNGYRIRCANINSLNYTTVAVNLPLKNHEQSLVYLEIYKKLLSCGISLRCTGSTVLDLAYVASGRIDCLFDFNPKPIDLIAGKLQAREAGCLTSNFTENNSDDRNYHTANLTSSPKFVRLITEKIRQYLPL
ncbi:inositol monophosphatase family protein [uncultured Buchnera sp.]|jgi:myo-inositol-1(or 4)-monophosphatase|uniref:inositol monophosphatase family protein n=1 Tax=uncultured Buchnera sp. TaxID=574037 RepID=UPI0025FDBED4|nr:inositol monophosphatase family protein [uncultured Buchnera sp.]